MKWILLIYFQIEEILKVAAKASNEKIELAIAPHVILTSIIPPLYFFRVSQYDVCWHYFLTSIPPNMLICVKAHLNSSQFKFLTHSSLSGLSLLCHITSSHFSLQCESKQQPMPLTSELYAVISQNKLSKVDVSPSVVPESEYTPAFFALDL